MASTVELTERCNYYTVTGRCGKKARYVLIQPWLHNGQTEEIEAGKFCAVHKDDVRTLKSERIEKITQ